jgi:hypothetical protein
MAADEAGPSAATHASGFAPYGIGVDMTLSLIREDGWLRYTSEGECQPIYYTTEAAWRAAHYNANTFTWYDLPTISQSATVTLTGKPSLTIYYHPVIPGYWTDGDPTVHWYSNVIRAWKGDVDQEQWVLPTLFTYDGVTAYWSNNGSYPYVIDWTMDDVSVYVLTGGYHLDPSDPPTYYDNEPYAVWRISWTTGDIDMMGIPMCANNANTPSFMSFTPRTILAAGGYVFVGSAKTEGSSGHPAILKLRYDDPAETPWGMSYVDYGAYGWVATLAGESGTNKWYGTATIVGGSYDLVSWSDAWFRVRTTSAPSSVAIWAYDDQAIVYEPDPVEGFQIVYTPDAGATWERLCYDLNFKPYSVYGGLTWKRDYVLFPVRQWPYGSPDNWNMGIFKKVDEEDGPVAFIGNTTEMMWGGPWFGTADASAEFPPPLVTTPGAISWADFTVPFAPAGVGTRVLFGSGYTYANLRTAPRRYALTYDGGSTWMDITDSVTDYNEGDFPAANTTYPFYLAMPADVTSGEPGQPLTVIRDGTGAIYRVVWEDGHPVDYMSSHRTLAIRGFGQDSGTGEFVDFVFARVDTLDVYNGQPAYARDFYGWTADATNFYLAVGHYYADAIYQINRANGSTRYLGTTNPEASHTDHGTAFEYTGNTAAIYPHTLQGVGMLDGKVYIGGTDSITWTGFLRVAPNANVCDVIYAPVPVGSAGDPWILSVVDGDPDRLWVALSGGNPAVNGASTSLWTYTANGTWTDVTAGLQNYAPPNRLYHFHPTWAGSGGRCLAVYFDRDVSDDWIVRMDWTSDAGATWTRVFSGIQDANPTVNGFLDLATPLSAVESDGVITLTMGEYWYPDPNTPYAAETTFHTFQIDAANGQVTDLGINSQRWETGDVGISIPGSAATWSVIGPTTTNCDLQYATIYGGNTVTVRGENFTPGTVLSLGTSFSADINLTATYINTTAMSFVTPNLIDTVVGPGTGVIRAYNPWAVSWFPWSGTANVFFQLGPANFDSVVPNTSPVTGGAGLLITGNNIHWKTLTSVGFGQSGYTLSANQMSNGVTIISNTQAFCIMPDLSWYYDDPVVGGTVVSFVYPVHQGSWDGGQAATHLITGLPVA